MQDVRGRFHEGSDLGGSCAALCRWRDVYRYALTWYVLYCIQIVHINVHVEQVVQIIPCGFLTFTLPT